jgi:hypothetical protein
MFDVGASMEESSQTFITAKISLFQRLSIPQSMCVDLLVSWQTHEG